MQKLHNDLKAGKWPNAALQSPLFHTDPFNLNLKKCAVYQISFQKEGQKIENIFLCTQ